jgi:hypothetical protein
MSDALSIWVIYDHPEDFPTSFVARRHIAYGPQAGPTQDLVVSTDVETLREILWLAGLTKLDRSPDDAPHIMETWL